MRTTLVALTALLALAAAQDSSGATTNLPTCSYSLCSVHSFAEQYCLWNGQRTTCGNCLFARACGCDRTVDRFYCHVPVVEPTEPHVEPTEPHVEPTEPRTEGPTEPGTAGKRQAAGVRCARLEEQVFDVRGTADLPSASWHDQAPVENVCCPLVDCSTTAPPNPDDIPCRERGQDGCTGACEWIESQVSCSGVKHAFCRERPTASNAGSVCTAELKCRRRLTDGATAVWPGCAPDVSLWEPSDHCHCSCEHDGHVWPAGSVRQDDCNTCQCFNRQWVCTERACGPGNCDDTCSTVPTFAPEPCHGSGLTANAEDIAGECVRNSDGVCVHKRRQCPNVPPPTDPEPTSTPGETRPPPCECDFSDLSRDLWVQCPDGTLRGPHCVHPDDDASRCAWVNRGCVCECDAVELAANPLVVCANDATRQSGLAPQCVHDVLNNRCRWLRRYCPAPEREVSFDVIAFRTDGTEVDCALIRARLVDAGIDASDVSVSSFVNEDGRKVCRVVVKIDAPTDNTNNDAALTDIADTIASDASYSVESIEVTPANSEEQPSLATVASTASMLLITVALVALFGL